MPSCQTAHPSKFSPGAKVIHLDVDHSSVSKIIEANKLIDPELQNVIKEVHPEVCFWKMGGEVSSLYSKRVTQGREERLNLLSSVGFDRISDVFSKYPRSEVKLDDIIDAAAAYWTAIRILKGEAIRLPAMPERDKSGLFMENWV